MDRVTRRQYLTGFATTGIVSIAGCIGGGSGGNNQSNGGNNQNNEGNNQNNGGNNADINKSLFSKITISHYPAVGYGLPHMVAKEKGYYKEVGLNAPKKVAGSSGGGTTLRNLSSGKLPVGAVATSASVSGYYANVPIKIVASSVPSSSNMIWMIKDDAEFDSLADAKDMSIGYTSPQSATQSLLEVAIERNDDIDRKNVELEQLGGISENTTALKQGDVDIGLVNGPDIDKLNGNGYKIAFKGGKVVPHFSQVSYAASEKDIKNNSEELKRYFEAQIKGVNFLSKSKGDQKREDEVAKIYSKYGSYTVQEAKQALKWLDFDTFWSIKLDKEALQTIELALKLFGERKTVDWDKVIDQSLLPKEKRIDIDF